MYTQGTAHRRRRYAARRASKFLTRTPPSTIRAIRAIRGFTPLSMKCRHSLGWFRANISGTRFSPRMSPISRMGWDEPGGLPRHGPRGRGPACTFASPPTDLVAMGLANDRKAAPPEAVRGETRVEVPDTYTPFDYPCDPRHPWFHSPFYEVSSLPWLVSCQHFGHPVLSTDVTDFTDGVGRAGDVSRRATVPVAGAVPCVHLRKPAHRSCSHGACECTRKGRRTAGGGTRRDARRSS